MVKYRLFYSLAKHRATMAKDVASADSSGLFDLSSAAGNKSLSALWAAPMEPSSRPAGYPRAQPQWSSEQGSLSRRGESNESKIRKSLAALDDVLTPSHTPHTPGSLFKESVRVAMATVDSSHEASLSIMDQRGGVRELLLNQTSVQTIPGHSLTATQPHILTAAETLTSDDPLERTSHELVLSFYRCYNAQNGVGEALELLKELEAACQEQIAAVQSSHQSHPSLVSELIMERNTWELLAVLYTDRLEDCDDMEDLALGGRSHKETAEEYFMQDSTVRQAQLVVDWLEKNTMLDLQKFPHKVDYVADNVCWENTLHNLDRGKDSGHIVTEMDPDAPRRQGRHLAELDDKDEQSLYRHLFNCIRAGNVGQAQELCVRHGQAWRAATLEGWRLHHDPNYHKNMLLDEIEPVEGNATRDLWKYSAWQLSCDPESSLFERAVYGSLSGNLGAVLPACSNWPDALWGYFKTMVDVLTERRLRGSSPTTGLPLEPLPAEYWNTILVPEVIFKEIEASPNSMIVKQSRNPFYVVQKFIILGNLDGLIAVLHDWLGESPNLYQLRFMAHLVFAATALGLSFDDERCSNIIQGYVKELIAERFHRCVALYTTKLPIALQVPCYAALLQGIEDPEEQRECLDLGSAAGLDIPVITKTVVENMRNTGIEEGVSCSWPELAPLPDTELTKLDKSKIEVIRWLIFDKGQRAEAIHQGNALMRQFLAARKLSAAEALFRKLPTDSVEVVQRLWASKAGESPLPAELVNDIHEYSCIKAYLECHVSFNQWFYHYHSNRPAHPEPSTGDFRDSVAFEHKLRQYEHEETTWGHQLSSLSEDAEVCLNKVLLCEGGWLVDPQQTEVVDQRRARQLTLLREVCIPQVTFLLHTVLHSTGQVRKCLQLADVVASEAHQLYKVFRGQELEHLLSLIHKTASAALADRHSNLGYSL